jgi:hypothetical protein
MAERVRWHEDDDPEGLRCWIWDGSTDRRRGSSAPLPASTALHEGIALVEPRRHHERLSK